jgi:hypothetical protein
MIILRGVPDTGRAVQAALQGTWVEFWWEVGGAWRHWGCWAWRTKSKGNLKSCWVVLEKRDGGRWAGAGAGPSLTRKPWVPQRASEK